MCEYNQKFQIIVYRSQWCLRVETVMEFFTLHSYQFENCHLSDIEWNDLDIYNAMSYVILSEHWLFNLTLTGYASQLCTIYKQIQVEYCTSKTNRAYLTKKSAQGLNISKGRINWRYHNHENSCFNQYNEMLAYI